MTSKSKLLSRKIARQSATIEPKAYKHGCDLKVVCTDCGIPTPHIQMTFGLLPNGDTSAKCLSCVKATEARAEALDALRGISTINE